jgi:hypothetical protein
MCAILVFSAESVNPLHQFEQEIGAASSENGFFIAKIEFSARTPDFSVPSARRLGTPKTL